MRLICLVNTIDNIISGNATTRLLTAALRRGHDVWLTQPDDLGLGTSDQITARAISAILDGDRFVLGAYKQLVVRASDVLFLRTRPDRDPNRQWAHHIAMSLARMARQQGVLVLSDPDGLTAAASKLYPTLLPRSLRPEALITRDPEQIRSYVLKSEEPVILKPLDGDRGRDIFRVHRDDLSNLTQIVDVLTRHGFAVVQRFLPAAREGDVRILLLDGAPIVVDGALAAIRRVPGDADFRSNLHFGGHLADAEMTPQLEAIIDAVGPRLREDGIFLASVDVIGDVVVEVNIFNPDKFAHAARFARLNVAGAVIDGIEKRAHAHHRR
ncbi:MAG: hypothetical protein AAFV53_34375 [Myxococcota bacterium]